MQTVHLQGIGQVQAKPAADIKPGDVLMWNFGYTSTVLALLSETAKSMVIQTRCEGGIFQRRLMKSRLVAIYWHEALLTLAK
jgi:hypothetical protein